MNGFKVLGIGLVLVCLTACGGTGGGTDPGASTGGETPPAGHGHEHGPGDAHDQAKQLVVPIEPRSNSGITGSATFSEDHGTVSLTIEIAGATPGEHAFHLHEIGDCSAPDGTSAGGHWNPTASDHGKWGVGAHHLGDVGNILVGADGRGSYSMKSNVWSIGTGEPGDIVGRAVIVHAGVDDFKTQPTGAAGGRIGCGVIR